MKHDLNNKDSHKDYLTFQKPISIGFLKSVLAFPNLNSIHINNRYYTYSDLFEIVYSIFKQLPADSKSERIGIYCSDDIYTYASIIAVNLYGAAYIPLNNKFPTARNKSIIKQCSLKLILSSVNDHNLDSISEDVEILNTSYKGELEGLFSDENWIKHFIENNDEKQSIAYILFTSGTTNEPKGVPVSHSNLNHFFDFFLKNYNFNMNDRFLQVYELTFDVSVFSIFMPLLVGACCYVLPIKQIKYSDIIQQIKEHKITIISMVPTVLRFLEKYMKEISLPTLRYSFFSGDALLHTLAFKWSASLPNAEIHNFYGPTETTIVCTRYVWNKSVSEKESVNNIVPLGKAFEGMEYLIINETNEPVEKGELCFYGTQVISEYLNNMNEVKFFVYGGKTYYKTGDVASIDNNYNLLFHGRNDDQVKINGYRVELREIEFAIERITNKRSKVYCIANKQELNELIAFIETKDFKEDVIRESLLAFIPTYLIPKKYYSVESFPLNSNGKVDKNQLINLFQYC